MPASSASRPRPLAKFVRLLLPVVLATCAASGLSGADAVPNFILYQGRLAQSGTAVSGTATVTATIIDSAAANLWQGTFTNVPLTSGLFTLRLGDTGESRPALPADLFAKSGLKLRLSVNTGSGAQTITPDLELVSSPYALRAQRANQADAVNDGAIATAQLADGAVTGIKIAASAITTDLLADSAVTTAKIADGTVTSAKLANGAITADKLSPNAITVTSLASNSVGSAQLAFSAVLTDKLGDGQVTTPKLENGSVTTAKLADGAVTAAKLGVAVWTRGTDSANGSDTLDNTVNNPLQIAVNSRTAVRIEPATEGDGGNLLSGESMVKSGVVGAVSWGGDRNDVNSYGQTYKDYDLNLIGGKNRVFDDYGTISGGAGNRVGDEDPDQNKSYATVSGGNQNTARNRSSTVGGGSNNLAMGDLSVIGGGEFNLASGAASTVSGGQDNIASADYSTIGGGWRNQATSPRSTISGGEFNQATTLYTTVGGGFSNIASGNFSTIGGGYGNIASGPISTISGGYNNRASGENSFAAGNNAKASNKGSFVFADTNGSYFESLADNSFSVRCTGGARFVTAINVADGVPTAGASLASGGTSWSVISDRRRKFGFAPVDCDQVLAQVRELPITSWHYDWENA